ncbi:hypothetical protein [Nocardioides dongkuii]|uniref:hypothetical protein n=1 Tax=Nocardioides dongkuii TaxID=2760089 RepID=UPI0015FC0254|nr:hypothetical protein [Nocardioides dongkuii]
MRRLAAVPAALVLLLAGCGGGSDPAPSADPSPSAESSDPSASAAPAWNPCDGLRVARIEAALGERLRKDSGTPDAPRCALVPRTEGGAVLDANYLVFPEGLDAAWEQMGAPDDGSATEPDVPGADDARLVAGTSEDGALTVTGFVQNGAVVQVVNAVDPAPYDRRAVLAAVRESMAQLSAYAGRGGAPS